MAFMDKVKGMLGIPEDTDMELDEDSLIPAKILFSENPRPLTSSRTK